MQFVLFVTVLVTAGVLVICAYLISKLLAPSSSNPIKGEPFECGIPTRGTAWIPMNIGYYLFAILFLMFDVETVFLYPLAVIIEHSEGCVFHGIGVFLCVLVLGLVYAWRKGALEWE
ncbi:MAG TPA: NADH-quinone oxidoreductase subunit A [Porphyromonadaceae bacterium]|nr:NADH-quinone oxidoreductase subunit A [Porphyromonadaceae bacterium]